MADAIQPAPESAQPQRRAPPAYEQPLPPYWEAKTTPTGDTYYVNHLTQTTQWDKPQVQPPPMPPPATRGLPVKAPADLGWTMWHITPVQITKALAYLCGILATVLIVIAIARKRWLFETVDECDVDIGLFRAKVKCTNYFKTIKVQDYEDFGGTNFHGQIAGTIVLCFAMLACTITGLAGLVARTYTKAGHWFLAAWAVGFTAAAVFGAIDHPELAINIERYLFRQPAFQSEYGIVDIDMDLASSYAIALVAWVLALAAAALSHILPIVAEHHFTLPVSKMLNSCVLVIGIVCVLLLLVAIPTREWLTSELTICEAGDISIGLFELAADCSLDSSTVELKDYDMFSDDFKGQTAAAVAFVLLQLVFLVLALVMLLKRRDAFTRLFFLIASGAGFLAVLVFGVVDRDDIEDQLGPYIQQEFSSASAPRMDLALSSSWGAAVAAFLLELLCAIISYLATRWDRQDELAAAATNPSQAAPVEGTTVASSPV